MLMLAATFPNIQENLEILAEECAEVAHVKAKIVRFGDEDTHPDGGPTNRERLEEECGHLLAMLDILIANNYLRTDRVLHARQQKLDKLPAWYGRNGGNFDSH